MQISKRNYKNDNFNNLYELKIGMCITGRINEENQIIYNGLGHSLPYPQFVYIVAKIEPNKILLIDTSHNNRWEIKEDGLLQCELVVEDIHSNVNEVDCEFINRALCNDYE